MYILLYIAIGAVAVYLILKVCLFVYRPIYLSKILQEVEDKYHKITSNLEKDLKEAVKDIEEWQNGDRIIRMVHPNEDDLKKRVDELHADKTHEQEMYEKFIRLKERFIQDKIKLSESIIVYKRYLDLYLKRNQDASIYTSALGAGVISFDEFVASANEAKILLEENERKLDMLLENNI